MDFNDDFDKMIPEKGDLMISEPFLPDPNFERTVILVCEHNEQGSFGFVLNKPSLLKLQDVMEDIDGFDALIYIGGPVQQDTLHFLHRIGDRLEGGEPINNEVQWGGNFEQLRILIQQGQVDEKDVVFFLGYSGWGEGQLMSEINEKSWIVHKSVKSDQVFDKDPNSLWRDVLKEMGGKYKMISNYPTDPRLN